MAKFQAIRREAGDDPTTCQDWVLPLPPNAPSPSPASVRQPRTCATSLLPTVNTASQSTVPADLAPPQSSSSPFPTTPPLSRTPPSNRPPDCAFPDPYARRVPDFFKKKTGNATDQIVEPSSTRKAHTPLRALARTFSAKHNALRDELANIARRTGPCADSDMLVDHLAFYPEDDARMLVCASPNEVLETLPSSLMCKLPPLLCGSRWKRGQGTCQRREQATHQVQTG